MTTRWKDLKSFWKIPLTITVLFSSVFGYLMGLGSADEAVFDWKVFLALIIGGFLVIVSSNGFNQVYEGESDKLMARTKERPIPRGAMRPFQGVLLSSFAGLIGILLLAYINVPCAVWGGVSLILYVLVYTPLKRRSPIAVLAGAFPGAMPVLIGWLAATGSFGMAPGILFAIQFLWQFPHFWAIAWLQDEEYRKAGIRLLPTGERDPASAYYVVIYSIWMIPISILPFLLSLIGYEIPLVQSWWAALLVFGLGIWLVIEAKVLWEKCTIPQAKKLMFNCLRYLPFVQLIYLIDKFVSS